MEWNKQLPKTTYFDAMAAYAHLLLKTVRKYINLLN